MNYTKYFILLCSLLVVQFMQSQELFPISSYTPDTYHGETQNWDICQSPQHIIYIANNKGLLEFNGASWKLYPSPNRTIMRSVYALGNRVYSGCYMEFGYWERDAFLNMKYTSLSSRIRRHLSEDEQFWNIIGYQRWVLFQSLHRIYIYDTAQRNFRIINSTAILPKMFAVRNQLYFQEMGKGILRLDKGRPVLVSNHPVFKSNTIINIFASGNKLLVETQDNGFFICEGKSVSPWKSPGASIINSLSVYSSLQLSDGNFVLGTIGDGIYFLSPDGAVTRHITKRNGLQNNTVLSLFEDADHNIWLGLDNGLNVLNYESPFRILIDDDGIFGNVYTSACHNGYLYLGTNQGLFYRPLHANTAFRFVRGTKGQVWTLKVIDNTLFCGHNLGTFIIDAGNNAHLICNQQGTWDIKPVEGHPNLLMQGNYEGLYILQKKGNSWQLRNKIEGFNISSRYFEQMPGQQIFVNHEYKGVYRLKVDADYRRVSLAERMQGVPLCANSGIIKYRGSLIYFVDSGFYKYNLQTRRFAKDNRLTHLVLGSDDYSSGKMVAINDETLWVFTKDYVSSVFSSSINSEPNTCRLAIPLSIRECMFGFENLLPLGGESYLLGTTNGYITFDMLKLGSKDYRIQFSNIEKSKSAYDQYYTPFSIDNHRAASSENNIRFNYYVPVFGKYSLVKYQYQLEGSNHEWSEWNHNPSVTFKNLPSGTYTFKVRAKVGDKLTSNIASFTFTIARPWYASIWMCIVYLLIIAYLLRAINKWYKKRYERREQEINRENLVVQLKNEKEITELKQANLNNEIESVNRDLVSTTMAVIRKDEILNDIKLKLQQGADNARINTVLKIIDDNIDKNGGWALFQDAFNNIDRNFLKKMKELHPLLTPNDLKLCVYLRLNLSSKEIAPMLNISPQSVEIKRFRLRKKMGLNHEENLTDYILNI
jgi:DNA-binding CsgD family transcriptional regulator